MLGIYNIFEGDSQTDADSIEHMFVNGLGFYSTGTASDSGFYVDQVSFSSERRQFVPENVNKPSCMLECITNFTIFAVSGPCSP